MSLLLNLDGGRALDPVSPVDSRDQRRAARLKQRLLQRPVSENYMLIGKRTETARQHFRIDNIRCLTRSDATSAAHMVRPA
jgi:hypothetical protein